MNNKVKFNICNCHYALQKTQENGEIGNVDRVGKTV